MSLDEHARAVHRAWAATDDEQLEQVVAALPHTRAAATGGAADGHRAAPRRWIVSILGGAEQRGRWSAPGPLVVLSLLGGAELDLGRACIPGDSLRITCIAVLGGVSITAPPGVPIEFSGLSILCGRSDERRRAEGVPGAPVVHVRAFTLLGGVSVDDRRRPSVDVEAGAEALVIRPRRLQARALGTGEVRIPYGSILRVRTGAAGPSPSRRTPIRGERLALFRDPERATTLGVGATTIAGRPVSEIAVEVDDPDRWCADLRHRAGEAAGNPLEGSAPAPL